MIKIIIAIIIIVLLAIFVFGFVKKNYYKGGNITILNSDEFRHSYTIMLGDALEYFKILLENENIVDTINVDYTSEIKYYGEQLKEKMDFDYVVFEEKNEIDNVYEDALKEFKIVYYKYDYNGNYKVIEPCKDNTLKDVYLFHSMHGIYTDDYTNILGPVSGINMNLLGENGYQGKGFYMGSYKSSCNSYLNMYGCTLGCLMKYSSYVLSLPFKENTTEYYRFMYKLTDNYNPNYITEPSESVKDIYKTVYCNVNGILLQIFREIDKKYGDEYSFMYTYYEKLISGQKLYYKFPNNNYYNCLFIGKNGKLITKRTTITFKPSETIDPKIIYVIQDNFDILSKITKDSVLNNVNQTIEFINKFIEFDTSLLDYDYVNSGYKDYKDYFIYKNIIYMVIEIIYGSIIKNYDGTYQFYNNFKLSKLSCYDEFNVNNLEDIYKFDVNDEKEFCLYDEEFSNDKIYRILDFAKYFNKEVNCKNIICYRYGKCGNTLDMRSWYMYEFVTTDYNNVYPVDIYFKNTGERTYSNGFF